MRLKEAVVTYKRDPNAQSPLRKLITTPSDVAEAFAHLQDEMKEKLVAVHLDTKNRIICFDVVSIGTLNSSLAHPREVFRVACMVGAAAVILVHNHPSGDPTPSREQ